MASISSSSISSSSTSVTGQEDDKIGNALRSLSIEDLQQHQTKYDPFEDPTESDDLQSRSRSSSSSGEDEAEYESADETADKKSSGDDSDAMETGSEEKAPSNGDRDESTGEGDKVIVTDQNQTSQNGSILNEGNGNIAEAETKAEAEINKEAQTSQNGSKLGNNNVNVIETEDKTEAEIVAEAEDKAEAEPSDQEMASGDFADFSLADLTAKGELERPELVANFQTSMYWLQMQLGKLIIKDSCRS